MRQKAIQSLMLVLVLWAATTATALVLLMQGNTQWAVVALCWKIWLVPGVAIHKIIETRQAWQGNRTELSEAYSVAPLLATGALALMVYFLAR